MSNLATHPRPRRPARCTGAELDRRLRQVKEQLWVGRTRPQVVRWAMNKLGVSRRTAQLYVRRSLQPRPVVHPIFQALELLREHWEACTTHAEPWSGFGMPRSTPRP